MAYATCHTEGCGNAEIHIEVELTYADWETGEVRRIDQVTCGVCGQPITDVQDREPTEPYYGLDGQLINPQEGPPT